MNWGYRRQLGLKERRYAELQNSWCSDAGLFALWDFEVGCFSRDLS
jgi:hypothetical protein